MVRVSKIDKLPIYVIEFPGTNCEIETMHALSTLGFKVKAFRWNEKPTLLDNSRGIVLPGGFSYQDRIRAGAVAAKDDILDKICRLSDVGLPILGICNGAQILLEVGIVPGLKKNSIQMALGKNLMKGRSTYICKWVYVRVNPDCSSPFVSRINREDAFPLPIAHAEGCYLSTNDVVLGSIKTMSLIALQYVDIEGNEAYNPNGSWGDCAGISNTSGNVLAMMPHPERALYLYQVPVNMKGVWGEKRTGLKQGFYSASGPGWAILEGFRNFR